MTRLSVVAVVVALVGLVVSVAAAWPRPLPPPAPEALPGPSATESARGRVAGGPDSPDGSTGAAAGPARSPRDPEDPATASTPPRSRAVLPPVAASIPAIGYVAVVEPVGVDRLARMALPVDPARLGWYRFGPSPAEPGSTVLAGHLDSVAFGVGPLVRLRDVVPGDRVAVTMSDGRTTTYVVASVDRYDREALPAKLFAREGARRLRIITCGGGYDADAGGYQLNLVVTAVPA